VAVLVAAPACGVSGAAKGAGDETLRINTYRSASSLDPALAPGPYGPNALIRQYSEPLLRAGADGTTVVGAAAERFNVSPDGLTYTFHLSPAGRYNDGSSVRAGDFVYAWRRLVDPRTAAPFAATFTEHLRNGRQLADVDGRDAAGVDAALDRLGLRAIDDATFEVTLAEAVPSFPWIATLSAGAPVRSDVVTRYGPGWALKPQTLVTNGPFRVSAVAAGSSVTLVPNRFYRTQPHLRRIVAYQLGTDANAAWARYLNDELDISNGPPAPALPAALGDQRLRGQETDRPEASISYLVLNTTRPPFDNPKVRLAVAKAVDRRLYARLGIGLVSLTPLDDLVPAGVPGRVAAASDPQAFDPGAARALLTASGVSRDQLGDVHLLTAPSDALAATLVQDQLRENLGVGAVIDSAEDASVRTSHGDFQLSLNGYFGAPFPDAGPFFDVFLAGRPANHSGWNDPRYDRLVTQADRTASSEERSRLYQQADEILAEAAPVAFMGQVVRHYWVKPWVHGIKVSAGDDADFPGDTASTAISVTRR